MLEPNCHSCIAYNYFYNWIRPTCVTVATIGYAQPASVVVHTASCAPVFGRLAAGYGFGAAWPLYRYYYQYQYWYQF